MSVRENVSGWVNDVCDEVENGCRVDVGRAMNKRVSEDVYVP